MRDRKPLIGIGGVLLLIGVFVQQAAWNDEQRQGAPTGRPYVPALYSASDSNN